MIAHGDLVGALKGVREHYDFATRRFIWKRLTTAKGHELMDKLLRNPSTYLSNSELRKLAEGG